jgi:ribosomal protein L20
MGNLRIAERPLSERCIFEEASFPNHTPDMQHPEHAAPRHSKMKKCYTAFRRLRRNIPLARERVQQPTHSGHAALSQSKAPFRLYRLRRVVAIARDKQLFHSRFCKLKPAHIPHVMNKIVDDLKHN